MPDPCAPGEFPDETDAPEHVPHDENDARGTTDGLGLHCVHLRSISVMDLRS